MANRKWLMKYLGSGRWGVCVLGNWHFNPRKTYKYVTKSSYGTQPDCGAGYYGTVGEAYDYFNGAWHGGGMFSGWHKLPASSSLAADEEAEPTVIPELSSSMPIVAADGTVPTRTTSASVARNDADSSGRTES